MTEGTYEKPGEPEDNMDTWGKGSAMAGAKAEREKNDAEYASRMNRPARQEPEDTGF